ncbi:hypothetical protein [Amycolatopsis sp. NPDC098790]|uniref:hypothetical protein n=1 Tax=Amycolatopsis sp. NPDC098790 TaxID=3363939 RepID=UPI00381131DA
MDLWSELGYSANPYSVAPLPPSAEGAELLVGREKELKQLRVQLSSTDTHPTIEGENGVGKTSLMFVAAYRAASDFNSGASSQLLLPVNQPLQIGTDADRFEKEAILAILSAYLTHEKVLEDAGLFVPQTQDLETWLRRPVIHGGGGGASIAGFGVNVNQSQTLNTTSGFSDVGLKATAREWLASTFPSRDKGAFVAVIDNIELLQTSKQARDVLEAVRDGVLDLPGVRWVLCGAKGIIRSAVSSPRLAGRISQPIELRPVPDELIPELMRRRLHHFANRPDPNPPVDPDGFGHLYRVSNNNLRNALKYAQDFSVWLMGEDQLAASDADKRALLEVWMAEVADQHTLAASLQNGQWKLLDEIAQDGGSIAPGDHEKFGYGSPQAMRFHLQRLEEANMVDTTIDETDSRRKTISITSLGWLVRYRRSEFQKMGKSDS